MMYLFTNKQNPSSAATHRTVAHTHTYFRLIDSLLNLFIIYYKIKKKKRVLLDKSFKISDAVR